MQRYRHEVKYYETDRMGITHHSNYIRWMEEARTEFLKNIGWSYAKFEEAGIISPVIETNCKYKRPTTFDDVVEIETYVINISAVKLEIGYEMYCNDELVAKGISKHCFTNRDGKILNLKKEYPKFVEQLAKYIK